MFILIFLYYYYYHHYHHLYLSRWESHQPVDAEENKLDIPVLAPSQTDKGIPGPCTTAKCVPRRAQRPHQWGPFRTWFTVGSQNGSNDPQ